MVIYFSFHVSLCKYVDNMYYSLVAYLWLLVVLVYTLFINIVKFAMGFFFSCIDFQYCTVFFSFYFVLFFVARDFDNMVFI